MIAAPWHDYQVEAAEFFRQVGLSAEVDARVKGVRGEHAVDVLVRGRTASIDQCWVIECKHWRSRVHKAAVATLAGIVQDLGADRGVLLSETGFQRGAHSFAQQQNITLTDLKTLRNDAAEEIVGLALETCRNRLLQLDDRLRGLTTTTRTGPSSEKLEARGRASIRSVLDLYAGIACARSAVDAARIGRWPVSYMQKNGPALRADSASELLGLLTVALAEMEDVMAQQVQAAAQ